MPRVYINPSNQKNEFVTGGYEEYYMNLVADAMIPYLERSGIEVTRSKPDQTLAESIAESNSGNYDLHIALQTTTSPDYLTGTLQGPSFIYYADNPKGQEAATVIAENLRAIYPRPNLVTTMPNRSMEELRETNATAVIAELGYHDNTIDAIWIQDNIKAIGRILALGTTQYFGIPFLRPIEQ